MPLVQRDGEVVALPDRLPVLPLRDVVVFPYVVMPLLVGRPASLAALDAASEGERLVLLATQRNAETADPSGTDLYRVGVVARLHQFSRLPNGTIKILVEGVSRVRVSRYTKGEGHLRATIAPIGADEDLDLPELQVLARRALGLFEEYVALHRRIPAEIVAIVQGADAVDRQTFGMAAHVGTRLEARQRLLEASSLADVLALLAQTLDGEIELLRLERKIDDDVRGSLFQNQREFYLQEQLKAIHRELGQDDGDELPQLDAQLAEKGLPDAVRARAIRELRKLRRTSPMSPEATVSRSFVDWILALPWSERTEDLLDVARARQVLDEDHFGLEDVKDRILDYVGVLSLVEQIHGPVLCLVGPPGVGKTSIGRSIARALGRVFVRMSLGGVRDEAEIRGHRRTYIGSQPGRVLQAMRRAGVVNPVILLDEIDKMGSDWRGDPAAALLEVLDPEQHTAFNDHYLEVDYDLSQVLFVTTANALASIPEPLRDRMEIIRIAGYLDHEKQAIARQYLIPRQLRQHGLAPEQVTWAPEVVPAIIQEYTREAGVRELERRIARVARKLARRRAERGAPTAGIASDTEPAAAQQAPPSDAPLTVGREDLQGLLGTPPFDPAASTLEDKIGVATGLAWTSVGGEILEIEVSVVRGRGKLSLTGTLGDVMKESASAALSYTRSRATTLGIDRDFYKTRDLHLHIPAGATPKDGPSAGIAIASAIASALTGVAVRGAVAMTGEITLRGRVLPIGGLKEKAVAAHRNRITHVIIPHGNARDVDELPAEVRETVTFHPVKTMDEVLAIALVQPLVRRDAARASDVEAHAPALYEATH